MTSNSSFEHFVFFLCSLESMQNCLTPSDWCVQDSLPRLWCSVSSYAGLYTHIVQPWKNGFQREIIIYTGAGNDRVKKGIEERRAEGGIKA